MTATDVSAQSHALVSMARFTYGGQPIWFAAKTGGDTTAESTQFYDGGSSQAENTGSKASTSNVVVTLMYRPRKHAARIKALRAQVGSYRDTITVQDTDADLRPLPVAPDLYPDALLVGVTSPPFDANSADRRTIDLTFAVGRTA